MPAADNRDEHEVIGLVCPECGEEVIDKPPAVLVPYAALRKPPPRYSHFDGEPLCPVIGPAGYQPAEPQEITRPNPYDD